MCQVRIKGLHRIDGRDKRMFSVSRKAIHGAHQEIADPFVTAIARAQIETVFTDEVNHPTNSKRP